MSSHRKSRILAHRGGAAFGDDNSASAILASSKAGASGVEIDVVQLGSGEAVAAHDTLIRGPAVGWAGDLSRSTLNAYYAERQIALPLTIDEAIDTAIASKMMVYLDIKSISANALRSILACWGGEISSGDIIFASSRAEILHTVSQVIPNSLRSLLFYDPHLDIGSIAEHLHVDFVHPCFDMWPEPLRLFDENYAKRARNLGYGVLSWNELDPERIRQLIDLEVDWLCTDDPRLVPV